MDHRMYISAVLLCSASCCPSLCSVFFCVLPEPPPSEAFEAGDHQVHPLNQYFVHVQRVPSTVAVCQLKSACISTSRYVLG